MTSFSERLKELRKRNNLTQQELADKVGTKRVNSKNGTHSRKYSETIKNTGYYH